MSRPFPSTASRFCSCHTAAAAPGTDVEDDRVFSCAVEPSALVVEVGWCRGVVVLEGGEGEARSMIRCPKIDQASEGGGPNLARDGALRPGVESSAVPLLRNVPGPGMALVVGAGPVLRQRAMAAGLSGRQAGMSHSSCSPHKPPSISSRAVGEMLRQCVTGSPKMAATP